MGAAVRSPCRLDTSSGSEGLSCIESALAWIERAESKGGPLAHFLPQALIICHVAWWCSLCALLLSFVCKLAVKRSLTSNYLVICFGMSIVFQGKKVAAIWPARPYLSCSIFKQAGEALSQVLSMAGSRASACISAGSINVWFCVCRNRVRGPKQSLLCPYLYRFKVVGSLVIFQKACSLVWDRGSNTMD